MRAALGGGFSGCRSCIAATAATVAAAYAAGLTTCTEKDFNSVTSTFAD